MSRNSLAEELSVTNNMHDEHAMQSLATQLKALETIRRDQVSALEQINKLQNRLNGASEGGGSSGSENTQHMLGEEYGVASALARKEKMAADNALEYVDALVAQLSDDALLPADNELQRTKKRRMESRPDTLRRDSRSRDRSLIRGVSETRAGPGDRAAALAGLGRSQSQMADVDVGGTGRARAGSVGDWDRTQTVPLRDRDRERERERDRRDRERERDRERDRENDRERGRDRERERDRDRDRDRDRERERARERGGRDRDRERDRERGRDREREKERDRDRDRDRDREAADRDKDRMRKRDRDSSSRRDPSEDTTGSRSQSVSTRPISKGSLVAARVATAGAGEQGEEWILATVLSYSSEKNRYTVQDYDVESAVRPTYVLSPRLVLFVSSESSANPSARRRLWDRARNPEMARGQRVLGLYPRTTAFYQGSVVLPPSLNTQPSHPSSLGAYGATLAVGSEQDAAAPPDPVTNPMYKVQFDDDDVKEVDVPAHLVIPMPKIS
ncbi:hypothetical protein IWW45_004992 [Coemansia sp. RSA 485]|nr:hypothetical protein IWW45_004992 [Coemansia sp. RSA 485]